jgi:hypothetical protein
MRKYGWILLIMLAGCGEPTGSQYGACEGHAVSALFQDGDCKCPLIEDLPTLNGKACSDDGLFCSAGSLGASDSCRCERGTWNCAGAFDMGATDQSPTD